MKNILRIAILFIIVTRVDAQIGLNINIGSQPKWGPVGYNHVDNYYMPEIETYYNVPTQQYTYYNNGTWVTTSQLPPVYKNYNLYKGYKVVLNEPQPYLHHDIYKVKYVKYKKVHNQKFIRDSRNSKYFESEDDPKHGEWKEKEHDDNRDKNKHKNKKDKD